MMTRLLKHLTLPLAFFLLTSTALAAEGPDTGDTAWMLVSSALVLLMLPGLALFYGGMTRAV